MKYENHQGQEAGRKWFSEHPQTTPIPQNRGRYRGFLSKDWIARGAIQRIGTTLIAIGFLFGSVALFVASLPVRNETSDKLGDVLGPLSGTLLAVLAFFLACAAMFLAIRLLRSVARSFYK